MHGRTINDVDPTEVRTKRIKNARALSCARRRTNARHYWRAFLFLRAGSAASYAAMGHFVFESVADFQASFGPHPQTIVGDIPNYTNSQPIPN
jgi:hypothetical protein